MNKKTRLMYDYICMFNGISVNRESRLLVNKTPELKYLLKNGFLKSTRPTKYFTKNKCTVLKSVENRIITEVFCPDCKVKLGSEDFTSIFNPQCRMSRRGIHKYNCSLRIDHSFDTNNKKQFKII